MSLAYRDEHISFFGFLRPDLSPWRYRNRLFLIAFCRLIVLRLNLKWPRGFSISITLRMEVYLYSYFWWCGYLQRPWASIVSTDEFSVRFTKITSRNGVSRTHGLSFCCWPIFYSMNYGHIIKGCKPDNFESHYSLQLSFTNIQDFCSNFVECESFLLCMRLTWLTQLILAISLWGVIFNLERF